MPAHPWAVAPASRRKGAPFVGDAVRAIRLGVAKQHQAKGHAQSPRPRRGIRTTSSTVRTRLPRMSRGRHADFGERPPGNDAPIGSLPLKSAGAKQQRMGLSIIPGLHHSYLPIFRNLAAALLILVNEQAGTAVTMYN